MENSIEIKGISELSLAVEWLDAQILKSGAELVAMYAPMGAGKTTLVGEYCRMKGIEEGISSPTFSIVNKYSGASGVIYHFDCYRFESEREAHDIGIYEYLDSGSLCFVEWPERIEGILAKCDVLNVRIEIISDEARRFSII
ncbi:MAG: tRNA (adenosine(37)-N6)-threonylcarbamoyltransferase complex ATPase subunit type 1 TsaE [Rikenellaceae bacterium]